MNGYLGRDKVWNEQIWNDIDTSVREEMGRMRVGQKVFPSVLFPNDAQPIPMGKVEYDKDDEAFELKEGDAKPFFEISAQFSLTKSEVDSEENLHTGRTLAKMAASKVAVAEDFIVLTGKPPEINGVTVTKEAFVHRFTYHNTKTPSTTETPPTADDIFKEVCAGIGALNKDFQYGPYALVLASVAYAQAFGTLSGNAGTAADRIALLATHGFYGTAVLPASTGILVSLGGEPATIYIGTDAITAFTQTTRVGRYCFRVYERIQFILRDEKAIKPIQFLKNKVAKD
jgi:uncharacterized linocin/CFP29 family protein